MADTKEKLQCLGIVFSALVSIRQEAVLVFDPDGEPELVISAGMKDDLSPEDAGAIAAAMMQHKESHLCVSSDGEALIVHESDKDVI